MFVSTLPFGCVVKVFEFGGDVPCRKFLCWTAASRRPRSIGRAFDPSSVLALLRLNDCGVLNGLFGLVNSVFTCAHRTQHAAGVMPAPHGHLSAAANLQNPALAFVEHLDKP